MAMISWSTSIQVQGGPTVSASQSSFVAEAIERIEVTINSEEENKIVSLQPEPAASVHLLLIKSSYYGNDLTFKVSDGTDDGEEVKLLGPQFFSGGAVSLFGRDPRLLKFTKGRNTPSAQIEVFIARDATP